MAMNRKYDAIYRNGRLHWISENPDIADGTHVIVIVGARQEPKLDDLQDVLDKAWGSLGSGQTLDEVEEEIRQRRKADWS
jgi:hypothetical protein